MDLFCAAVFSGFLGYPGREPQPPGVRPGNV